tara:strand:+ start:188 stop:325 length:138 start_codon:yes stop_codon:yes gene_type:complete
MIEKLEIIEKILANIMCDIEDEDIYLDLSKVLQIIDGILGETNDQ